MDRGISELRQKILSGVISSKEITLDILRRIQANELNCYISLLDAEEQAEIVDKKIKDGFCGALCGIPVAIKDNMRYKGSITTCGSAILKDAPRDEYDCEAVKRLKEAGAVIIGKTNMDEFAMGSSNMTSAFGPVRNPINHNAVPGGSSGGSAAAVAASLCYAALGSDTGGSIRQPASYCGVVGLKPTFGSIDGSGMYALSQDMDQIGPLARSVDDCALIFEVLSGKKYIKQGTNVRVGIIKEYYEWLSDDTREVLKRAFEVLSSAGCTFYEVSVPSVGAAFSTYCVLGNANSAKNLSGIGNREERTKLLGKEVKKRILIGEYVSLHPEVVQVALNAKKRIIDELNCALDKCDVIVTPTAPSAAFSMDADKSRRDIVYSDVFTQPPSIAGLPALSVPCIINKDGLPLGVQLFAAKYQENLLFSLGKLFE